MRLTIALAALLLLAACGSSKDDDTPQTAAAPAATAPAKETGPKISNADAKAVRDQIFPNWLPPEQPPCHQPLKVRIDLAADGSVVRAEARPELAYDDPCRGAMDAALRAVWAANPLRLPRNRAWSSLTLVFDKDAPQ